MKDVTLPINVHSNCGKYRTDSISLVCTRPRCGLNILGRHVCGDHYPPVTPALLAICDTQHSVDKKTFMLQ